MFLHPIVGIGIIHESILEASLMPPLRECVRVVCFGCLPYSIHTATRIVPREQLWAVSNDKDEMETYFWGIGENDV
jgi:hypothetical protein